MPRAMPIIASVVRKDGMPTRVVSSAVDEPDDAADREAGEDAGDSAIPVHATAATSEASPATMPIERSISPAAST